MRIRQRRPRWAVGNVLFIVLCAVGPTEGSEGKSREAAPGERPTGRVAILDEPDMPVKGAASDARLVGRILSDAGMQTRQLSAAQLADGGVLNPREFDVLVVATGEGFPAAARDSVLAFLRGGGSLITAGGYAFNHLLRRTDHQWVSEADLLRARFEEATRKEKSLLVNGDFETKQELPAPGQSTKDQWQRSSSACDLVGEGVRQGRSCARVAIAPDSGSLGAMVWQDLPARRGRAYQISGWLRTEEIIDSGFAFMAVYQYGADDKLIEWTDFVHTQGTADWTRHAFTFVPKANTTRLHIKFGIYEAHGTAWFDDLRLCDVTGTEFKAMNTSTGEPRDGLVVSAEQIGVFDPSFPLKRARSLRTAPGQHVIRDRIDIAHDVNGWAACGVVGNDDARWIPLLQTYDRYDRPRGAAGAMLLHYKGHYAGSAWAFFGVDNLDLFNRTDGAMAHVLQSVARFLVRKTFLRNLGTDHRLYRPDEPVKVSVFVDNRGARPQAVTVRFHMSPADADDPAVVEQRNVSVQPGTAERVEVILSDIPAATDLCRLTAVMSIDGEPIDEMTTGFVVERPEVLRAGPRLRFQDNYFTLDGRPMFLFGSDTYAYTYHSAHENPLTWSQEHVAARDAGMNLYENLQYSNPGHKMEDDDWRSFRAMSQLTQKHGLVFMPGMLIGHNVAIGDEMLAEQSEQCRGYAEKLHDTPGLLYYINGDYQMQTGEHPEAVKALWNRWLRDRYGTTDGLKAAWGDSAVSGELGEIAFGPPDVGRWDNAAAVDRGRFQCWLTRRWNESHVAAIRTVDREHPTTSEYYQFPFAGMDLVLTIDGQDVSNIGFFDRPGHDLDILPLKIRFNDLRARGKGVSLGEYGVKTHPAWTVDNGATHYHVVRSEEEQKQLFLAVAHYGLGLGACKVQNWCLSDAQTHVFPWGIFYPNQLVSKDVAYTHRNQSIIWRHFAPIYKPAGLTVCIPDNLRLGKQERIGYKVADEAFETLLSLHYDFNVIDDHHLDQLPSETRAIVYPSPFAVSDEAYGRLLSWVKAGRRLLVTGDFSYDADRRRTRIERLTELAGVQFAGQRYASIFRPASESMTALRLGTSSSFPLSPCIDVRAEGAEVLGSTGDGRPVFVRHAVGQGQVYYLTDPIELSNDEADIAARRAVYSAFLQTTPLRPLDVQPNQPSLHVMQQPTADGTVYVLFDRKREEGTQHVSLATTAGRIKLQARNRYPALAAVTGDGKVVAAGAWGSASVDDEPVMGGTGLKAMLSLDGADLRQSQALLVAPFEAGTLDLPRREGRMVAVPGEFQNGRWTAFEQLALSGPHARLDIDQDRATCLVLVCQADAVERWTAHLTRTMNRPWETRKY